MPYYFVLCTVAWRGQMKFQPLLAMSWIPVIGRSRLGNEAAHSKERTNLPESESSKNRNKKSLKHGKEMERIAYSKQRDTFQIRQIKAREGQGLSGRNATVLVSVIVDDLKTHEEYWRIMKIKHKWVQRRTHITGLLGKHIVRHCQTLSHETRREQGRESPKPIVLES